MFGQNCSRPALHCGQVPSESTMQPTAARSPRVVLGNCRADLGYTADDLVAGNNRVIRGHELAPLVADRMEIGVADAAEEDLDLHVAVSRIATLDLSGGQRRCRAGSRVSLRVVRSWMHT